MPCAGGFLRLSIEQEQSDGLGSTEISTFLARGGHGPEHQELLRLIGTLVKDTEVVVVRL